MNRVFLTAGLSAVLLAGCSILPESTPVDIYRLGSPNAGEGATREFGAPTVMISLPSASRSVGGDSIMVARGDRSMAVAAGARWAAPARNMVQDYIIETFEVEAPGLAPLRPGDGIAGDYDLSIDLRDFQAEYDAGLEAAPLVRVSAGARLISASRDLQGATVAASEIRAGGNRMAEIVAAFDRATGEIASELAAWTVEVVAEAERRAAAEAAREGRGEVPPADRDLDVSVDVEVD